MGCPITHLQEQGEGAPTELLEDSFRAQPSEPALASHLCRGPSQEQHTEQILPPPLQAPPCQRNGNMYHRRESYLHVLHPRQCLPEPPLCPQSPFTFLSLGAEAGIRGHHSILQVRSSDGPGHRAWQLFLAQENPMGTPGGGKAYGPCAAEAV